MHRIVQDRAGHLWFTTGGGGVSRYDGKTFQNITRKDGLVSNYVWTGFEDSNGDLWFGTTDGVTRYRPPTPFPPPVFIDAVVADHRYEGVPELAFPSTVGLTSFEFHGMSFKTRPDGMVYRYRLKGYEQDWKTTRARRIEYQDLPQGTYTFELQAIDRDLGYSETPATVALTVHLPYERIGLLTALGIAVVLIGWQTTRVIRRDGRLQESNKALSDANKDLFQLNKDLLRERAVERIREQVQSMERASDFEKVLSLLADDLNQAGLRFETCGIDVLNEPVDEPSMAYFEANGFGYTTYTIDPDGAVTSDSYHIPAPFPPVYLETIERFIVGQPWQGSSEQTAILEVPASSYGRLRITTSDRDEFTEEEIQTLDDFAGAVALGYARFLDFKAVETAQQKVIEGMERELQTAHDMQMGLLPDSPPEVKGIELSGICIPANHVGGDYYNFFHLDDARQKVGIFLADVSGKGMQAATVAMRFNEILRYEARGRTSAMEILTGLDESLRGQIPMEMFVTCGIGVLDTASQSLTVASGANPEVYHYSKADESVRALGLTGLPLGIPLKPEGRELYSSVDLDLTPGDVIVFTSDGIEEAQDSQEAFYGQDRLVSLIQEAARDGASAEGIRDKIVADVTRFIGEAAQIDDLTCVALRVGDHIR